MRMNQKTNRSGKKWVWAVLALLLAGGAVIWYLFTEKFDDTKTVKEDFTVEALAFIKEFQQNSSQANQKYSEKIIVVNGTVSEIKSADTSTNIIMADTTSGDYIIFDFQQQHQAEARALKPGDAVSVKGSCSNGVYSQILGVNSISFKRCTINK